MKLIDDMVKFASQNTGKLLSVPLMLSLSEWVGNLLVAISDGVIDEQEFHNMLQFSSGSQAVMLAIIMALLRKKQ